MPTASLIKVPILVGLYDAVRERGHDLDSPIGANGNRRCAMRQANAVYPDSGRRAVLPHAPQAPRRLLPGARGFSPDLFFGAASARGRLL